MTVVATRPRLGFLGVGWIGRSRLEAVARSGVADVRAVADAAPEAAEAAAATIGAETARSLDELLEAELDGIVIATPSALHAEQAVAALAHGLAVFCQKPLGRTAEETRRVVEAARDADRLLAVDLAYRHTEAGRRMRDAVATLGDVHAVDLAFHNAYGPDRPWYLDRELGGGGCLIDLGIHLVDLALWALDFPPVRVRSARILGEPVERYASAELDLGGAVGRLACSWWLPAGRDAVIEAAFYGAEAGAALRNVDGSFYDLRAELFRGTVAETLAEPPDDWMGRAAVEWAARLARGEGFDPEAERLVEVARVLDGIYGVARR